VIRGDGTRLATVRQVRDIRDLERRLGIEPAPLIIWAKQAREVTKRLLDNLAHRQQLSLFEEAR
jgi:hypothetical protein